MTYYQKKLEELKTLIYSNQKQLDIVIGLRNYINEHYERDLNLDILSQTQSISKYHMLRLFKRHYGQTPHQYLIDKRIEKAKELLKNRHSVTQTCYAVGFESVGSFSSLFKLKIGKTPTQFQKEQLSRSSIS